MSILAACGGDDGGTVVATGPHHHFLLNKAFIPKNSTEAHMYGLDLNNDKAVDNQLGMVLGTLGSRGFNIQESIDTAVNDGSIILLADVQTADYQASSGAGLKVLIGSNPMPTACADATDKVCGRHLVSGSKFDAAASDAEVTGKIVNGTLNAGPGSLNLKLSLAGATVDLSLIGARAQVTGMTDGKIDSAILAGAVTQDDLNMKILPAIQMSLGPVIAKDCTKLDMPAANPACGCADGSTGKTVISLFDTTPKDCKVTTAEIQNNGIIMSLLQPDVTINGEMAISLGIKVTGVAATYTVAGE